MTYSMEKKVELICKKALKASSQIANISEKKRDKALIKIANNILKNSKKIENANEKDIKLAKKNSVNSNLIDRLLLDSGRIKNLSTDIKNIVKLKSPIGRLLDKKIRPNGLKISKVSVPLGVIAVIYESRPNVTSDVAALCIKSGNAVILKGGKEAKYTTELLIKIIKESLEKSRINSDCVLSLKDYSRNAVNHLFKMDRYVDVLIPRGGKNLVKNVRDNCKIPVFSHLDGICHTYIDQYAKKNMAINVSFNAKMRRTSICGATETILCHQKSSDKILPTLIKKLFKDGCKVVGDSKVKKYDKKIIKAKQNDWETEYLDAKVSIKIVDSLNDAIKHINTYSSGHTDAIITDNLKNAKIFIKNIESAIVMHNTSTQFADGAEFGLGAEIGISTGKLHARGPVSLDGLTTYKYIVVGKGQLRK